MASNQPMTICIYCLEEFPKEKLTVDHVIARSWFPNDTSPVEKWKVPSCQQCNNVKSFHEGEILFKAAWCMDPSDKTVAHIIDKAKRAIDPKCSTSAKDAMHRLNRKYALGRDVRDINRIRSASILPAFFGNAAKGSKTGIMIPADSLNNVVIMWMRGIYFCHFEQNIPEAAELNSYFVSDKVADEAFSDILKHATHLQKGPGVEVFIWHVEENGQAMTNFAFNIWNNFRAYGTVELLDET